MRSSPMLDRPRRLLLLALAVTVLLPMLTALTVLSHPAPAHAATSTPYTCAMGSLTGDGNPEDADRTIATGDNTIVTVVNDGGLPNPVTFVPEGGLAQGVTLPPWPLPGNSHDFTIPKAAHTVYPYDHSFTLRASGIPDADGDESITIMYFIKSDTCSNQRQLTVTQKAGTGIAPVTGTGTLTFNLALSAPAAVASSISYENETGNGCGVIFGTVTFNAGEQAKSINVPINAEPAGSPAQTISLVLSQSQMIVPASVTATGTITSTKGTPPTTPIPPAKPATPAGLKATGKSTNLVNLAWNSSSGATGYRLFKNGAQVAQVSGLGATAAGLSDNTAYSFQVAAYNGAGQSGLSPALSVKTQPTWIQSITKMDLTDSAGHGVDAQNLRPGQHITMTLTITNAGSATWSPSGSSPVLLGTVNNVSSPLVDPSWVRANRAAYIPVTVAPGATVTMKVPLLAPDANTSGAAEFTLVAENTSWFTGGIASVQFRVKPLLGITTSATGGYWLAAPDGGVFSYDGAQFYGSMGGQALNAPVSGMAATPTGKGYWLTAQDGGVFAYGDAGFHGSMAGQHLNAPIVAIAATASGNGYWLVGSDGGVFAYGDAGFYGSEAGTALNKPVSGIAAAKDGAGYTLVAQDGGVFTFGSAQFYGSRGATGSAQRVLGIATLTEGGYSMVASDGTVATFGSRIATADSDGYCYVKEGRVSGAWTSVRGPNCQQISLSGNRIATKDSDGYCYAKEGAIGAAWTQLRGPNCQAITMSGDRIATKDSDGYCYVKEGDLGAGWATERGPDCQAVSLSGDRIGTQDSDGYCYVKAGDLGAGWTSEAGDCQAVSLAGERIGVQSDGYCYVKEGDLGAGWISERGPNCQTISLSGDRIATKDSDGYCYAKQGDLGAGWTTLRGPNCQAISVAGNRSATRDSDGYCYLSEGPLGSAWTAVRGPNCLAISLGDET